MDDEIFTVKARRCRRCGRLLTSSKAVEAGYGEACRCKVKKEEADRQPFSGQIELSDILKSEQQDK